MSQADVFKATLEAQLGEPYVLGDEGPATHDCSGLHYEGQRGAGVLWRGRPWPRETANDYKNKAVPAGPPYRVGWPVFFMGTSGHAYHVASITEVDPDGRDGWTIEARGRRWGVVRYRMSDPRNGVLARGGKVYRYPGIDLGELEDEMDQVTFDKMADDWAKRNILAVWPPDLKEASEGCAEIGLLETRHKGTAAVSVNLFRVALWRLAKKAGLT